MDGGQRGATWICGLLRWWGGNKTTGKPKAGEEKARQLGTSPVFREGHEQKEHNGHSSTDGDPKTDSSSETRKLRPEHTGTNLSGAPVAWHSVFQPVRPPSHAAPSHDASSRADGRSIPGTAGCPVFSRSLPGNGISSGCRCVAVRTSAEELHCPATWFRQQLDNESASCALGFVARDPDDTV